MYDLLYNLLPLRWVYPNSQAIMGIENGPAEWYIHPCFMHIRHKMQVVLSHLCYLSYATLAGPGVCYIVQLWTDILYEEPAPS